MTLTHQTSLRTVRLRALLALVVLLCSGLTAASAAADTSPVPAAGGATAPVAADPSAAPPAVASTAPAAPAPSAPPAASGGAPAATATPTGQTPITAAATSTPVPPVGDDIQAQPAILAVGSANAPLEHPTHYPNSPPPSSGASPSSGQHANLEQPIVGSTSSRVSTYRPEVTQLASGGPLVTSGVASPAAAHPTRPAAPHAASLNSLLLYAMGPAAPRLAPAVDVSVSQLDLYVTTATSARHPGQKSSPFAPPISPAGVPASKISPFGPGVPDQPGGAASLFGNAPFSSGGSTAPLLGLNALLAAVTLLGGMAWRRRSWDLPVFSGESALLSTALDRPG